MSFVALLNILLSFFFVQVWNFNHSQARGTKLSHPAKTISIVPACNYFQMVKNV